MKIEDFLIQDRILLDVRVPQKEQLLHTLARRLTTPTLSSKVIGDALMARELLGSTGVGQGIALPHARLGGLPSVRGLFARLHRPIPFEAIDDVPVDIVFLTLLPDSEGGGTVGTAALAAVARCLRQESVVTKLRRCETAEDLFAALQEGEAATSPGGAPRSA